MVSNARYREHDPVTYSKFRPGKIFQLDCGHIFSHNTIINGVLTDSGKCPLCRKIHNPINISLQLQYIKLKCGHFVSPVTGKKLIDKGINNCPEKGCHKKFESQLLKYMLTETHLGCGCNRKYNYQTCLNLMQNLRWNHCPGCKEHIDKDFLNFQLRNIQLDCGHEYYWEYLVDKEECPHDNCNEKCNINKLVESELLIQTFPGFD